MNCGPVRQVADPHRPALDSSHARIHRALLTRTDFYPLPGVARSAVASREWTILRAVVTHAEGHLAPSSGESCCSPTRECSRCANLVGFESMFPVLLIGAGSCRERSLLKGGACANNAP